MALLQWSLMIVGTLSLSTGNMIQGELLNGTVSQTTSYHLPFNYDPNSNRGPLSWKNVPVEGNEWEQYVGQELIDLDIDGNECHSKRRPSPINLVANSKCRDNHQMLTRKPKHMDCRMDDVTFSMTPHSLRVDFPTSDDDCWRPTIDLPNGYPYKWIIHHMEVHIRAEHVVDGRRYDGELQMYHLGQEDQKREMAAVSVLLDASGLQDNPKLQEYIDKWQEVSDELKSNCTNNTRRLENLYSENDANHEEVKKSDQRNRKRNDWTDVEKRRLERMDAEGYASAKDEITPEEEEAGWGPRRHLFPYDIWPTIYFYRYKGSLTVPPCSEIVSWRVLDEPLVISRRQLKHLAHLLRHGHVNSETCEPDTAVHPTTGESYRPLQTLNHEHQTLVHCTSHDFGHRMYHPDQQ
eukprot:scaffold4111_cov49-Attheya_sp.AAC.5